MPKKVIKYVISIAIILLVAYNSVYFKKLDEVKVAQSAKTFNAALYAQNFWDKKLAPALNTAVDVSKLVPMLTSNPAQAFDNYSHALGIGNLRYFLVHAEGKVTTITPDGITLAVNGLQEQTISIATEYIFGNAARDATGLVDINDFSNTMDFNNVSSEINKIIRVRVLPLLKNIRVGNNISFTGAVELNKEHVNTQQIEAIPLSVNILP